MHVYIDFGFGWGEGIRGGAELELALPVWFF